MIPTEPIRPLQDVWLRPRRVFRELAKQPIGKMDYLLGAAQGIVSWLALSRAQSAGATSSVWEIIGKALFIGPIAGVASLFLMAAIYARLGRRAGGVSTRNPVLHVLAYGSVPMVVSLGIWLATALITGEAAFVETPPPDAEGFVAILVQVQFISYVLLMLWSVLLQVMGFSEIQELTVRRAFGVWVLGQVIGFLAMFFLAIVFATLFPNIVPR